MSPRDSDSISCDLLRKWNLRLFQPKNGYRFAVDSLLLAEFAALPEKGKLMDLGAGCGVVGLIAARRRPGLKVVAVELQKRLYELAVRNAIFNGLSDRVRVINEDIKNLRKIFAPEEFDFVITNPPYLDPERGRIASSEEEALARYEIAIKLSELLDTARYLLKYRGRFALVFTARRTAELIDALREKKLEPKRIRFVHPFLNATAEFILVEAVKGAKPELDVEPPLVIYHEPGRYTEEVAQLIGVKTDEGD